MRTVTGVGTALLLVGLAASTAVAAGARPGDPAGARVLAEVELRPAVAAQLADRSGDVLVLADRLGTAQTTRLPEPVAVGPADLAGGYRAGDVAYWAPEQLLIVFTTDGSALPDGGLTLVGRVSQGLDALAGCARDCAVGVTAGAAAAG